MSKETILSYENNNGSLILSKLSKKKIITI